MRSRRSGARAASIAPALLLTAALTACSQGGHTAAERARATTLPTPTKTGVDTQQLLSDRVHHLLAAPAVAGDEDLVVDDTETAARLGWKAQGTVLDASVLTIGTSEPGVEVFRSPTVFLSRPTGNGDACWAQASPSLARFDRPTAPEIAVLESARATSGDGSLVTGSVSALAALRLVGTDAELRRRALLPPTGVQVAATFGTGEPGLQITIKWSDLVAAAGNSSRHSRLGTWTLRFEPAGTAGPAAPPAGQVVSVAATDPTYASALRTCNAGIR